ARPSASNMRLRTAFGTRSSIPAPTGLRHLSKTKNSARDERRRSQDFAEGLRRRLWRQEASRERAVRDSARNSFHRLPHHLSPQARRSNGRRDGDGRRKHRLHVHLSAVHLPALILAKERRHLVVAAFLACFAAVLYFALWLEAFDELHIQPAP